ncbi:MAG: hypothetical protein E6Q76_07350 [Rhizobium sp.]|nr:MAG: hypothetical protein E6Q76_07350 [Rhizobium sp.]
MHKHAIVTPSSAKGFDSPSALDGEITMFFWALIVLQVAVVAGFFIAALGGFGMSKSARLHQEKMAVLTHDHEYRVKGLDHQVSMGKLGLKRDQFLYEVKKDGLARRDMRASVRAAEKSSSSAQDAANEGTVSPVFRASELLAAESENIREAALAKKTGKRKPKVSKPETATPVEPSPDTEDLDEHCDVPEA